jgi:cytoskeletal protein CcmA (bactofilin family)
MSDAKNGHARKTLVEEGTQFKGSLSSECPVEVKGRIDGDLTAPALAVSASGAVHGHVKVGALSSQGELAGEFDADVVQLSGTVKDNTVIRAKSLEVKLSPDKGKLQVIFGECELEVGSQPPARRKDAGEKDKPKEPEPPKPASAAHASAPPAAETNGSSSPS